jgi:dTMP kinase
LVLSAAEVTLYANGVSFALSGLILAGVWSALPPGPGRSGGERLGVLSSVVEGWRYAGSTPLVRALVVGIAGAFAAGGVVIGLGRVFVDELGAGEPGYGVLFGAVFAGLGAGMWQGPRLLRGVTRKRLFGLALTAAGFVLLALSLVSDMVLAVLFTLLLGACAGVCWITGYTLLGLEVEPAMRGRTFALVQSLVRLVLALVLAAAPLLAGLIGHHRVRINDDAALTYGGVQLSFAVAGSVGCRCRGGILPLDERSTWCVGGHRAATVGGPTTPVRRARPVLALRGRRGCRQVDAGAAARRRAGRSGR